MTIHQFLLIVIGITFIISEILSYRVILKNHVRYRSTYMAETKEPGKVWKSGEIFTKNNNPKIVEQNRDQSSHNRRSSSNDPWWMRNEEENNPNMLPTYKPWWLESNFLVDSSWKLTKLKLEAKRRGLDIVGKKDEIIERINAIAVIYDLSTDNFQSPIYIANNDTLLPKCYPEIYSNATPK